MELIKDHDDVLSVMHKLGLILKRVKYGESRPNCLKKERRCAVIIPCYSHYLRYLSSLPATGLETMRFAERRRLKRLSRWSNSGPCLVVAITTTCDRCRRPVASRALYHLIS